MRRTATLALLMLALTACGGYTPQEQAFLNDMQQRSASIKQADPDGTLTKGHAACDFLAGVKPDQRGNARYFAQQPSHFGYGIVDAATTHLCPEYKA